MHRAFRAVRRQKCASECFLSNEHEKDTLADAEEDMAPGLLCERFQPKDFSVKRFGLIQVINIDGGFNKMVNPRRLHDCPSRTHSLVWRQRKPDGSRFSNRI
jgi:hypothetical protein